tara:strand:+ start:71 stop:196 length:126 start_codon:yes stop_codon:yes gene_type:complete
MQDYSEKLKIKSENAEDTEDFLIVHHTYYLDYVFVDIAEAE